MTRTADHGNDGVMFSPEDVRAKLEAGRAAVAARLRELADDIETLPVEDAVEAFTWIGEQIDRLLREADRMFGADPSNRRT
jgi:hypothetical protein